MTNNPKISDDLTSTNAVKDPDNWTTGGESMIAAQASYLKTLSEEAGEEFYASLSKGEASKRIDALQGEIGRGKDHLARLSGVLSEHTRPSLLLVGFGAGINCRSCLDRAEGHRKR